MEMIVNKNQTRLIESVSKDSKWSDIAEVINLGSDIQRYAFNAAVEKGAEEGLYGNELVNKLKDKGCSVGSIHIYNTLLYYEFKFELDQTQQEKSILNIPKTEAQYRDLTGDTAQEKVEQFTEITEAIGHAPSRQDVRDFQKNIGEIADMTNCTSVPQHSDNKGKKKQIISSVEELNTFRIWLKAEKKIDAIEDKPKINLMLLSKERDDMLNTLGSRVPEWKSARKIMIKLLHPDSGGNTLAMQFFKEFDELMNNLSKAYEYVMFENKIAKLKEEWKTIQDN